MRKKNAREWALDILVEWEEKEAYSNLLLKESLGKSQLSPRDRRLVTEMVYGSIQRLYTLDTILNKLVKKGTQQLDPWVRALLRLGIYQLLYLDGIPTRAAVHETVQIAKKRGHKGIASLVNGVLRSCLRQPPSFPTSPQTVAEKSFLYSYPEWMVERIQEVYGEEIACRIMASTLEPAKMSLRFNRLQIEDWTARFQTWDQSVTPSQVVPEGAIWIEGGNPANTSAYEKGEYTLQDESAMLVSRLLQPESGMRVLDACSAPGGKTTHIAELMEDQGEILACDIYDHKIDLVRRQAERLGISSIEAQRLDARKLSVEQQGKFDRILLDAPCSGLGVIRRKPDLKWQKEAHQISSLASLQKELLSSVAPLLKERGVLLYSTCTWEPTENLEQIVSFLQNHSEFMLDTDLENDLPQLVQENAIRGEGWVQILPHHLGSDGFFIARLRKI